METLSVAFDDVLLVPQFSDIEHRDQIDIGSHLGLFEYDLPIISAPMDTVTEERMALSMFDSGGLGILHRFCTIKEQIVMVGQFKKNISMYAPIGRLGAAIGVTGDYFERAQELTEAGVKILCLDIAHGHHLLMKKALERLREELDPDVHIMAGNVATADAFLDLAEWGANSIKVGIGGGSICSTREMTGHGVPTFTSVLDCGLAKKYRPGVALIADGGIRSSGDIVKALWAGSDFCMLGSMLAGTDETPGKIIEDIPYHTISSNYIAPKYKIYRGMASEEAQKDWKGEVNSREGIATRIPYKGPVRPILEKLRTNIRSGLSYAGASDIFELRNNGKITQITNAGKVESTTHILDSGGRRI